MVRVIRKKKGSLKYSFRNYFFIIIAFVLALAALGTYYFLNNNNNNFTTGSHAATPVYNRLLWQGNNWYVNGANVPWYNWGCDFGCNATNGKNGGVSTNLATLTPVFQQAKNSGVHVLRWWVFPGTPWQITTDSNGVPNGINPAVYTDFDAALNLASQYDLYYDFVLFSAPTAMNTAWETNTTQRAALVNALSTLFAHYKSNPRILSWEIYNEPENDIWSNKIAQQPVVDTGTAIATAVHTSSPGTLVTVGSLMADGMPMWLNAGLDYFSPHWYDYMSSGNYCMICNTYNHYSTLWGINKPIVVGEFWTGTSSTTPYSSSYRYNYFYNNGFAGTWAWSLFPSRTSDGMQIDLAASATFASQHSDLGPIAGVVPSATSALPTPTPIPTTAPQSTPTSTPSPTTGTTYNLGFTSKGSLLDSYDAQNINGTRFTTGARGGTAFSISVYVGKVDRHPYNRYQMAIYSDSNGSPANLIASTTTGSLNGNKWNTLPIVARISPNTTYWLVYNTNAIHSADNNMYYSNGSSGQGIYAARSFGSWPSVFPGPSFGNWKFSIFVTYR